MREIQGEARTVNQLLRGVKYSVDYYQREYKWKSKQVMELVKDLTSQFLEDYQPEYERRRVEEYSHYFLGSIIISNKDGTSYIVDGQQRLTSFTLILIYLRNLRRELPDELRGPALPHFIDWLVENVHLVKIAAYSDEDAYTIFETMNDQGLSLTVTEMLSGLLILPKQFNISYGALAYEDKLEHYNTQNLLARSLHPLCHEHNPGFLGFVNRSGLPFRPHEHFKKADLEERGELYRKIVERIWNPDDLLREAGA